MKNKNLVCLFAIFFIAAASARAGQSSSEARAPRAVVPFTSFDFGDIYKGEIISLDFVIKNEGTADLVIKEFVSGCGCEITNADRFIPPGKEGKAQLEVNTSTQFGQITKPATLRTNDPEHPNIVLTLSANVLTSADGGPVQGVAIRQGKHIGPIFIGPDVRAGINVAAGQKGKAVFDITVEKAPLKVLRVESEGKYFTARLETVEEGKKYKVIVEAVATETPGIYDETFRVVTDSRLLPSFKIFAFLNAQPRQ
jgi:hypothetical protein